jgi:nucleoside-diphosphate-sugar epimerase
MGGRGWLGKEISNVLSGSGLVVEMVGDSSWNLTSYKRYFEKEDPQFLISAARMSKYDQVNSYLECLEFVAQQCIERNIRLVHAGSASEYGDLGSRSIQESSTCKPQSDYGKLKLAESEIIARNINLGLDAVIGRIFNLVGEGQPYHTALSQIYSTILNLSEKGKGSYSLNDYDIVRDYVFLNDIAVAFKTLLNSSTCGIVNLGSGTGTALSQLVSRMCKDLGIEFEFGNLSEHRIKSVVANTDFAESLGLRLHSAETMNFKELFHSCE